MTTAAGQTCASSVEQSTPTQEHTYLVICFESGLQLFVLLDDLRDGPKHPYVTVLDFYVCV